MLQKVKSQGGAGAEVQTKPPLPPLDSELAAVIFPQMSSIQVMNSQMKSKLLLTIEKVYSTYIHTYI